MILYSITMNIEKSAHDQWLTWMKAHHVPAILQTGLFSDNKMLKLLSEEENNPGVTYSFQFYLKDLDALQKYQLEYEPEIDAKLYSRYKDLFVEFRTVLEVV